LIQSIGRLIESLGKWEINDETIHFYDEKVIIRINGIVFSLRD